jgi:hypothetical protein
MPDFWLTAFSGRPAANYTMGVAGSDPTAQKSAFWQAPVMVIP